MLLSITHQSHFSVWDTSFLSEMNHMRRCGTQSIHPTYGCAETARKKAKEQKTYHVRKEPSSHESRLLRPRLHRGLERLVTEGGEGESPGRQQSAHCPVTSSTSPPPDTFTTHSLMMNPLQFFNTYTSLFPCTVFSIYRTHHCMRCLTHGSKLPQATTDSSHPAAETPQHKPSQSLKWTVSSLLFGFMLKISCLTMQILKVLEQCSDELKWTFLMETM